MQKYPLEGATGRSAAHQAAHDGAGPQHRRVPDGAVIRKSIDAGDFDGVAIARPLIANRDLPKILAAGNALPDQPCSFCNRCLVNAIANPLGCYDVERYDGDYDAMIAEVMEVYDPPHFTDQGCPSHPRSTA